MKKILLITGRNAAESVKEYAKPSKIPVEIHVCNIDVASMVTPEIVHRELRKSNLGEISAILVPGTAKGNFSGITEDLKIPCFKGPENLVDLPYLLRKLSKSDIRLSPEIPANSILENEIQKGIDKELENAYRPKKYSLKIGRNNPVFSGLGISHIVAEIPDAPQLSDSRIREISNYYKNSGAGIIDIGMISGEDNSGEIPRIVNAVRSIARIPISIDSLNRNEILAAVNSGIDLILSLDFTNIEMWLNLLGSDKCPRRSLGHIASSLKIPSVIIPRDEKGRIPGNGNLRIELIEKLIKKLKKENYKKFIVDLVLDPPNMGFVEAISTYSYFRKKHPEIPMLLGVGNITELMDADSIGINAVLAAIASELEIDLLFTTEASPKTKGSVGELSMAARMMYLSKKRKQYPKDLGIDLLYLKEKRIIENVIDPREKNIKEVSITRDRELQLEGVEFRIYAGDSKINVVYYKNKNPKLKLSGESASKIYKEMIRRGLTKNLEHAAYLGRELEKAEIALKLGKNYVQDKELF